MPVASAILLDVIILGVLSTVVALSVVGWAAAVVDLDSPGDDLTEDSGNCRSRSNSTMRVGIGWVGLVLLAVDVLGVP